MIFGHFTTSYMIFKWVRPSYSKYDLAWGILGAYIPDLLDKSFAKIGIFETSRTIGHGLLFTVVLGVFAFIVQSRILKPLTLGVLFHQLEDCVDLTTWLWPLLGPWPNIEKPYSLWESFYLYYTFQRNSFEIWIEIIGHVLFITYIFYHIRE